MNRLINYGADDTFFAEAARYPEQKLARVVAHYGDLYRIVTEQGEGLGEISGKFRHGILERAGYPVVGDFVMADRKNDGVR